MAEPDTTGPLASGPGTTTAGRLQVADLSNLPDDDSPRVELVDGALQVTPFPTLGHQDISGLLCTWLRCHAPADIRATQAVAVELE